MKILNFQLQQRQRNHPNYNKDSNEWKSLTEAVTFYIAKDAMHISTVSVEKLGLLHMLKQFDQRYIPPSRKTMSKNHLPKL